MRFFAFVTLASLVAVGQCGVITEPQEIEVGPYSFIDPIIKLILESFRPKLANITLNDINENIRETNLNASIVVRNISLKNAEKFVIQKLVSKVLPLQLVNLTLILRDVTASAIYDIDANVSLAAGSPPVRIFAEGNASASLNDIFFTIGANFELKNKALQIKPKGLFGFDLIIKRTNIIFTSLLGDPNLANTVSVFLSQIIPQLVDTLKKPVFNAYQDIIIKIVNDVLKNNGTTFMDEDPALEQAPLLNILDLSKEAGSFLGDFFESSEEDNLKFNF